MERKYYTTLHGYTSSEMTRYTCDVPKGTIVYIVSGIEINETMLRTLDGLIISFGNDMSYERLSNSGLYTKEIELSIGMKKLLKLLE